MTASMDEERASLPSSPATEHEDGGDSACWAHRVCPGMRSAQPGGAPGRVRSMRSSVPFTRRKVSAFENRRSRNWRRESAICRSLHGSTVDVRGRDLNPRPLGYEQAARCRSAYLLLPAIPYGLGRRCRAVRWVSSCPACSDLSWSQCRHKNGRDKRTISPCRPFPSRTSNAILTARSRNSSRYFGCAAMTLHPLRDQSLQDSRGVPPVRHGTFASAVGRDTAER